MSGLGKLYYDSGSLAYEGGFLNNKVDGHGIMYNDLQIKSTVRGNNTNDFRDLENVGNYWVSFEGIFKQDMKHGVGKWLLANGDVFWGCFAEDKADGYGEYRSSAEYGGEPHTFLGVWKRNKLVTLLN